MKNTNLRVLHLLQKTLLIDIRNTVTPKNAFLKNFTIYIDVTVLQLSAQYVVGSCWQSQVGLKGGSNSGKKN